MREAGRRHRRCSAFHSLVKSRTMPIRNNVTRLLDSRRISYTAYELPGEKLGALETARLLDVEPASVFKTIVVARDKPKKPLLALVPGPSNVDLKALAAALGEKKVHLPTEREAEQLTGLQAGGISPLALINKGFQVVIDSSAQNYIEIHVSGGQRGLNIKLSVDDLAKLTNARFASVSAEP
ncbi:aminoacyl-tRNA deacylase [Chloroflexi bacterium CFX6]|nr:aminoacyl-tRNA deacylase [Chloroflexi bacterium CFX6]